MFLTENLGNSLLHVMPAMTGTISCANCNTVISMRPKLPLCKPCYLRVRKMQAKDPFVDRQTFNFSRKLAIDQPYCVPYSYQGVMRKLIHLFKIGQDGPAQLILRNLLNRWVKLHRDYFANFDCIVPVPSMRRYLTPSFESASLIASWISEATSLRQFRILHRSHKMKKQTTLSKQDRLLNPRSKWTVKKTQFAIGNHALLVDDVMTTGSTLFHCSSELKESGVGRVSCFALAGGMAR